VRPVGGSEWKGTANSQFALLVDPLDPQRYYAFCFVKIGAVPANELGPIARQSLAEAALLVIGPVPTDVDVALATNFRDRVAERLNQFGASRETRAAVPPGNIFHRDTKIERRSPFVQVVLPIVDAYQAMPPRSRYQNDRNRALAALETAVQAADKFVPQSVRDTLAGSPPQVPSPDAAIKSATPFDLESFDFSATLEALEKSKDAAAKESEAAGKAIETLHDSVLDLSDDVRRYAAEYERLREAATRAVSFAALEARQVTVGLGSTVLDADTNRAVYVSLDTGMAYSWELETVAFYAGTNVYLRPINKKAPLRGFSRRFAITVGVTTSIKDESRRADDLRTTTDPGGSNSVLLGAGLRVTPSVRVGAGALVFREADPNPLITQKSAAVTPYVSFALDVDLGAMLQKLFQP
jgi:hypothetical protein